MIVQASVAVSVDGYIDDLSDRRLVLSHAADWEEVRSLRAESDAILVGAETIRRDNPALVTRDERLRELRAEQGLPADPVKVTLSRNADLDPTSRFFTEGDGEKIVFVGRCAPQDRTAALSRVATVIHAGSDCLTADYLIGELGRKGIERLFIEGGSRVLTLFLSENRIDYLRVAVAPFFVGEPSAPRMTIGAKFPFDKDRRMTVLDVKKVGDMTVTDYALGQQATDRTRLLQAIGLSLKCPPSDKAYSVGAVLVTRDGQVFTGYSRETAPDNHAEEETILKAEQAGATLEGATIYSLHGALFDPSFEASVLLRTDYRPPHEARRFRRTRARSLRPLPGRTIAPRRRDRSVRTGVARQTGARSQCPHSLRAIVNPAAESSTRPDAADRRA